MTWSVGLLTTYANDGLKIYSESMGQKSDKYYVERENIQILFRLNFFFIYITACMCIQQINKIGIRLYSEKKK